MKIRRLRLCALVAASIGVLGAGLGIAQDDVERRAAQLKIYTFGEVNASGYEVVGRPWIDSWRSAYSVPTFPSQEQAIAALRTEAARRGADGLLNVSCLDQGRWQWSSNTEPAFLCYGIAIRTRPSQR
jgi:hypothetical protein